MNKTPYFSIITTTLNSAATINSCILSVVGQECKDFEYIIIDGKSCDGTLELINEYQKSYPCIKLFSEKDKGIYDAMNKGIQKATGEWIYFLGSDDKLNDPNVLSEVLQETCSSDFKILYGNVKLRGNADWASDGSIYDGEYDLGKLIKKNICHQAMFVRREVFLGNGLYNLKFNICADWDMNLRLWAKYKFKYINKIIAEFQGGNASSKNINNYKLTDKWDSILKSFKIRIFSPPFTAFCPEMLFVSKQYKTNKNYMKYILFMLAGNYHKSKIDI